jgi:hypothetical protein
MLNFITTKKDQRFEYRFYTDHTEEIEGLVLYRGHKLGVQDHILAGILDYKMERMSNKIYIMDYNSDGRWFASNSSDTKYALDSSYNSLQELAEKQFGKFRKIVITRV